MVCMWTWSRYVTIDFGLYVRIMRLNRAKRTFVGNHASGYMLPHKRQKVHACMCNLLISSSVLVSCAPSADQILVGGQGDGTFVDLQDVASLKIEVVGEHVTSPVNESEFPSSSNREILFSISATFRR